MKKVIITSILAAFVFTLGTVNAQDKGKKEAAPAKKEAAPAKKEAAPAAPAAPAPMQGQMGKGPTVEERAAQAVSRMADRVKDLNADQKKKLTDIHVASFKQADLDKDLAKSDMEKFKEASKARVLKLRDEIKAIMTEAQWKEYTTPPPRPEQKPAEDKKEEPKK